MAQLPRSHGNDAGSHHQGKVAGKEIPEPFCLRRDRVPASIICSLFGRGLRGA
jgi:hypothetical protein